MTARPVDLLKDREGLKRLLEKKLGITYKKGDTKKSSYRLVVIKFMNQIS